MLQGIKSKISLFFPHLIYVFFYVFQSKQQVCPYSELTGWFLLLRQTVFTAR